MVPEQPEDVCRQIYAETKAFYSANPDDYGGVGFQILYGPPHLRPPILFLGYQPGGGVADYHNEISKGAHDGWPLVCEYSTEPWKLAERLRKMFGSQLLEQCVGLNAIFIRSPKIEIYNTLSQAARLRVQEFCIPRAKRIVEVLQPKKVVAIGFATLDLFGGGMSGIADEKGRDLTRLGTICGRPLIGTVHLSGYRISNFNLGRIAEHVLSDD